MSGPDGGTAEDRAATWLGAHLGSLGGQALARDVLAAALTAGHRERTVRRAARTLGVQVSRETFGGPHAWALPGHGADPALGAAASTSAEVEPVAETVAASPTAQVVSARDIYDRPAEFVQVNGHAAASHWDQSAWHRID